MAMAEGFETAFVKIGADTSALMKAINEVPGHLTGMQAQLNEKLGAIANKLGAETESLFKRVGTQLSDMGKSLSIGVTLPIVGAGTAIMKFGMDFETAMTRVKVLGDVSAADMKKLEEQAISLGAKTKYSGEEAARGMGELAASGFKANEILAAMPGVLGLAASGQVSVALASETAATVLKGFAMDAGEAGRVADVLAAAAADSNIGVADLANSFKYIGPVASATGVKFEEVAGALMIMGDAGIKGEKAGTGMVQMLTDLINPTKLGAEAMERLGLKIKDSEGQMLPLAVIVEQLHQKQATATSKTDFLAEAFKIWGQRAADVLPLIEKGGEALAKKSAALHDAKGKAEAMGLALENNLKGSIGQFKSGIENLGITLSKSFGPAIKDVVDWGTKLVNKLIEVAKEFKTAPQWVQTTTLALAAILAAIGPVTLGLGQLMLAWTNLAPVMTVGASAMGSVVGVLPALVTNMGSFISLAKEFGVVSSLGAAFPGLSSAVGGASTAISGLAATMGLSLPVLGLIVVAVAAVGTAAYLMYKNWADVGPVVIGLWKDISAIGKEVWGGLVEWLSMIWGPVIGIYKTVWGGTYTWLKENWETISNVATTIWKGLTTYLGIVWGPVILVIETVWKGIQTFLGVTWGSIREIAESVWNAIIAKIKWAVDKLSNLFPETAKGLREWGTHADKAKDSTEKLAGAVKAGESPMAAYEKALKALNETVGGSGPGSQVSTQNKAKDALDLTSYAYVKLQGVAEKTLQSVSQEMLAFIGTTEDLERELEGLVVSFGKLPPKVLAIPPMIEAMSREMAADMKAAGKEMSDSQEKAGTKTQEVWEKTTEKVKGFWTGFNDFGRDVLRGFSDWVVDSIFGLFSTKQNEELRKEEAQLRASLAQQEADWEVYKGDVATKMEALTAKHATELSRELTALETQLAAKLADYEEYKAEIESKIVAITDKHDTQLALELERLEGRLSDARVSYDRYVEDINDKREQITTKHKDQLAEELEKLADSLADRTEAYEDFVADTKTKIARITTNFKDSVDDETRDTQRGIADKITAFERYQVEIETKIAQELAKGARANLAQVADWRQSLVNRREDLGTYITRAEEDLADFTADHKRTAAQQVTDAQTALERKERDFAEFQVEIAKKEAAARENYKLELGRELEALNTSLTRRTEDFISFQQDMLIEMQRATTNHETEKAKELAALRESLADRAVQMAAFERGMATKIEEATAKHKAELEKEKADLKAAFAAKDLEYQKHILAVQTKLNDLEARHKTAFGRLKEFFTSTLSSMGATLVDKLITNGFDKLLRSIPGFETSLVNLGSKLGSVFSGIGNTLSNLETRVKTVGEKAVTAANSISAVEAGQKAGASVGSAGGSAASVASAVSSALTGWVAPISAAVSAITGVLTYLQGRRMEQDIGRIEVSNREIAADMVNVRRDLWDQHNGAMTRLGEVGTALFTRLGEIWTTLLDIASILSAGLDVVPIAPTEAGGAAEPGPGESGTRGSDGGTRTGLVASREQRYGLPTGALMEAFELRDSMLGQQSGGMRDVYLTVNAPTGDGDDIAGVVMDALFRLLPST